GKRRKRREAEGSWGNGVGSDGCEHGSILRAAGATSNQPPVAHWSLATSIWRLHYILAHGATNPHRLLGPTIVISSPAGVLDAALVADGGQHRLQPDRRRARCAVVHAVDPVSECAVQGAEVAARWLELGHHTAGPHDR